MRPVFVVDAQPWEDTPDMLLSSESMELPTARLRLRRAMSASTSPGVERWTEDEAGSAAGSNTVLSV